MKSMIIGFAICLVCFSASAQKIQNEIIVHTALGDSDVAGKELKELCNRTIISGIVFFAERASLKLSGCRYREHLKMQGKWFGLK